MLDHDERDDENQREQPRSHQEMAAMLDQIEALVWLSRYRHSSLASAPQDIRAGAHAEACRIEAEYGVTLAAIDLDDEQYVARLEGQQAALRWALSSFHTQLLPYGELYDS